MYLTKCVLLLTYTDFSNSHENSSGYYCVYSYYLSKMFGDLIPLRLLPIPIFALTAYWMIGNVYDYFNVITI